jgi:hypothetical protein
MHVDQVANGVSMLVWMKRNVHVQSALSRIECTRNRTMTSIQILPSTHVAVSKIYHAVKLLIYAVYRRIVPLIQQPVTKLRRPAKGSSANSHYRSCEFSLVEQKLEPYAKGSKGSVSLAKTVIFVSLTV